MAFDPDKYLAETEPKPKVFDPDAYLKETAPPIEDDRPSTLGGMITKASKDSIAASTGALGMIAKALGYPVGLTTTAAAGAFGQANLEDLEKALKGNATRASEYYKRANVPPGPSVNLPFVGETNARDALGFATEVGLDPLTYVGGVGVGNHLVGDAVAESGQNLYRAGLKKVDQEVAKYGKAPVSDILMNNRVTGSAKDIAGAMDALAADRLAKRDAILSRSTKAGAITDADKSLIAAEGFIGDMKAKNDPRLNDLIERMQKEVDLLKTSTSPTPEQMTAMKSNSYSVVGDQGYNASKATPFWQRFEKAVGRGQKEEVERAVGQTLGDQERQALIQHNDELGRLLTSQEKAEQAARIAENKNAITSVDAMIAGAGHGLSPMLIAKKVVDVAKEAPFRTSGGLFLQDLGQTRVPDVLARRMYINNISPWAQMEKK